MNETGCQLDYENARKSGLRNYNSNVSKGQIGYLPSLEGMLTDVEIVAHIELGNFEIPLKKIVGTYTHSRSLTFSNNFMPLSPGNSEFREKWVAVAEHQLHDGITDPIKVYEYLNWFYVVEGNKRVSVAKYFDLYSLNASITRLIPKRDKTDLTNTIYYEFLDFNAKTKLYSIWFSRRKSFGKLLKLLENYNPAPSSSLVTYTKYKHFETFVYNVFRNVYLENGGQKLPITTGDAFLEYAKLCGIPDMLNEEDLRVPIKGLIKELQYFKKDDNFDIQTDPEETTSQPSVFSVLTNLIKPPKKLNCAFVYARTIDTSGWTYSHEIGRRYIDDVLKGQISTSYIENVPESDDAYEQIKQLAEAGNDIIFTTSPVFRNATLRCALEHPEVKFFNCSEHNPKAHLSNYYGRTYEPRFLTGIIAGSMTKSNIIGYSAPAPNAEVISAINSFALGAKLVNPYCKVKVVWTHAWNSHIKAPDATDKLIEAGSDIISNLVLTVPRDITKRFGVYSMLCSINPKTKMPDAYLAAPIWNWGAFYEKILTNVLNGTYKMVADMSGPNTKLVNFWWGLASGVLDIYYSKTHVPLDTQKLINLMKKMIATNDYHPFTGPIYDNNNNLAIPLDETASTEQILSMDWFVDNVICDNCD